MINPSSVENFAIIYATFLRRCLSEWMLLLSFVFIVLTVCRRNKKLFCAFPKWCSGTKQPNHVSQISGHKTFSRNLTASSFSPTEDGVTKSLLYTHCKQRMSFSAHSEPFSRCFMTILQRFIARCTANFLRSLRSSWVSSKPFHFKNCFLLLFRLLLLAVYLSRVSNEDRNRDIVRSAFLPFIDPRIYFHT